MSEIVVDNQWNDFLVRQVDPYAHSKYEILMSWLGSIEGEKVLVIGSGSGEFVAWLAKARADVTAIDISQECIDFTRQTAKKFQVDIKTMVSSIEDFNSDEKFDIIVATDVIEHVEDDYNACKKIHSMLASDGRIVITVPALQFLFGHHDEVLGHYRRYSKATLLKLSKNFFSISHIRYYGFLMIPVALVISRWLRVPYPVQAVGEKSTEPGIISKIIRSIFRFEKNISLPLGTSLLMIGNPKELK